MSIFSINRAVSFLAIAGVIGAGSLHAAGAGQFHLPMAAHWGSSTLQPGDYKILVMSLPSGFKQVSIQREGKTWSVLPLAMDVKDSNGKSSLELVERDGDYYVRAYRSDSVGKVYTFGVPKHPVQYQAKTLDVPTE